MRIDVLTCLEDGTQVLKTVEVPDDYLGSGEEGTEESEAEA